MVEIIKKVNRVARKPHRCDYCHMMIYEGEEYSYSFLKCNGESYSWYAHKHCDRIAEDLYSYMDPGEGITHEDFDEGCYNFCQDFVCPYCDSFNHDDLECNENGMYCIDHIAKFLETHTVYKDYDGYWKCMLK